MTLFIEWRNIMQFPMHFFSPKGGEMRELIWFSKLITVWESIWLVKNSSAHKIHICHFNPTCIRILLHFGRKGAQISQPGVAHSGRIWLTAIWTHEAALCHHKPLIQLAQYCLPWVTVTFQSLWLGKVFSCNFDLRSFTWACQDWDFFMQTSSSATEPERSWNLKGLPFERPFKKHPLLK